MNVHDYGTRLDQYRDRMAAKRCACGHRADQHRERGYGNPGHEAGRFYCQVEGCDCTRYETEG